MRRLADLLLLALMAGLACACHLRNGASEGPRSWIDTPAAGSSLPFGPVEVSFGASYPGGISSIEIWIDGAVYARLASPDPKMKQVTMRQTWEPTLAGSYLLQVRARDGTGAWGAYASTQVTVRAKEVTATPSASSTAPPTATPPPTGTSAPTDVPTKAPRPTRTPGPTETPVVISAPTPAPPRPGPTILGATVSTAHFYYGAGCGPQQMTITVPVTDPDGVASVRIHFFLADKSSSGLTKEASLEMAQGQGGWSRTIDPAADIPGYNSFREAWFQFHFEATNTKGLTSKSPGYWTGFTLSRCGG